MAVYSIDKTSTENIVIVIHWNDKFSFFSVSCTVTEIIGPIACFSWHAFQWLARYRSYVRFKYGV
jgi:hypothetical protein